ncbi:GARNL3 family protein [Megaselia abdita]
MEESHDDTVYATGGPTKKFKEEVKNKSMLFVKGRSLSPEPSSSKKKRSKLQRSERLHSDSSNSSMSSWETLLKESFGHVAWPIKIKSWELVDDHGQKVPYSSSATELISRRGVFSRRHYGSVDQIPQTDLEGNDPNCKRFRLENGESLAEKDEVFGSPSTPILENPEHQTRWYFKYFLGKLHQNYVGVDIEKQPYFLSIVSQDYGNQNHCLYRAILFRKQGAHKIALPNNTNQKLNVKQILSNFSGIDTATKNPKEIFSADIQKDLLLLEEQEGSVNFKFGVIYMKSGQTCDDEMLSNEEGSKDFNDFLNILGEKIVLKGWERYRGGLDVKGDMTGMCSVYTMYEGHEIMFHVSTLLPFSRDNRQQVERKRHIGNDIVNIIFMDISEESLEADQDEPPMFDPNCIKSQFTHIFALVTKKKNNYRLAIYCDETVPPFGPTLPSPPEFGDISLFREFVLVKLINAEKSTFQTPTFSRKRERTLEMLIKDLYEEHVHDNKLNMLNRRAFSEVLYDAPRTTKLKEEARQIEFVRIGQALKLEAIVRGDAPTSLASASPCTLYKRPPWEPHCFYPSFQHSGFPKLIGDSFGDDGLFMTCENGTYLIKEEQTNEQLIFDKSFCVKQLNVLEEHDLLLVRGGSYANRDGHQIHVFRLKEFLNENFKTKSRSEVKVRRIERTRSCHLFATSKNTGGYLKLIVAVGKKIEIFQWKHTAAYTTWCSDNDNETNEGFIFLRELIMVDVPSIITILEGPASENLICVGYKYHFEVVNDTTGVLNKIFEVEMTKRNHARLNSCIELCDGLETELLLCYNHTCHFQKINDESNFSEFDFHWNSSPLSIVCAFPYILAFTSDSIEIRLLVNGSLVHTAIMPQLQLISAKRDIFFVTTAPEIFTKELSPKELSISEVICSRKSSQENINEPMNLDSDFSALLTLPDGKLLSNTGSYIQRARSIQKSSCSSDEKKCIAKSNSCGDHVQTADIPDESIDVPSNTPKPAVSPSRRPSNTRYRLLFQQETSSNEAEEKPKPLRVYRIPLVNLAGNQSHFHTHTSKIKPILKLVNNKVEENNIEKKSNIDMIIDNKLNNDVTKKLNTVVDKNPIDKITCNCANLSLFTS